jgi:NADH:ubiquinone oxidoreductase subunit 6 (subunit J)
MVGSLFCYVCKHVLRVFVGMLKYMLVLAGLILGSIISMLLTINPINAVIFLIIAFICSAMSFILTNLDFVGFLFLMVYIGAITVLFLFIVMIINIRKIEYDNTTYLIIGGLIVLIICMQIVYVYLNKITLISFNEVSLFDNNTILSAHSLKDQINRHNVIYQLGILLFSEYYAFIGCSAIILLISVLGAILLTSSRNGLHSRMQYNQIIKHMRVMNLQII